MHIRVRSYITIWCDPTADLWSPRYPPFVSSSVSPILHVPHNVPFSKTPRPILKQVSSTFNSSTRSARVHFPPSPRLSTFQFTHSPQLYDRSPLIVQPNLCTLPGRGEHVYLAEELDTAAQDDTFRDLTPPRDSHFQPERPLETTTYPIPSTTFPLLLTQSLTSLMARSPTRPTRATSVPPC
jgi:hypothetical protein